MHYFNLMQLYYFYQHAEHLQVMVSLQPLPEQKLLFRWLDCCRDDVVNQTEHWQAYIQQLTQFQLNEFHLRDILNLEHPCTFDSMHDYDLLIFRKLIGPDDQIHQNRAQHERQMALYGLATTPVSFIVCANVLVSLREQGNVAIEHYIERIQRVLERDTTQQNKPRKLPNSPIDLCLRFMNSMVDGYLDLRAPLTQRVEFWQTELLQGRRRFNKWQQLFQENMAFQHMENLCEEQIETLQELRDELTENDHHLHIEHARHQTLALVRVNDLISHVERIQKHTLRLRVAIQSAIDLHFSAIANQTNENMRILAIITAVFAPLTLLTGVYGMNFEFIPGLKSRIGFWMMLFVMLMTTTLLLYYFYRQHLLGRGEKSVMDLLAAQQQQRSLNLFWFLNDETIQQSLKKVEKFTKFK